MGIFGKLKNILFEEDEETEIPVYTKEDVKEEVKSTPTVEEVAPKPIVADENRTFTNIKRDIDIPQEEKDIIDEIPSSVEVKTEPVMEIPRKEERSVFQDFDETEFNILNAHEDNPFKEVEVKSEQVEETDIISDRELKEIERKKSYIIEEDDTKKPFKASPVISPVYGVMGKNYTKEDIVDKKDGIKRVREVIKPIKSEKREEPKTEAPKKVDIDSIRKKAYGDEEEIEIPKKKEEPKIEEKKLDKVVEDKIEVNDEVKKVKALDELEKTSTLQILDDIEKELNNVKPAKKEEKVEVPEENKKNLDDTLETDLFDLIDSMYEKGDEE